LKVGEVVEQSTAAREQSKLKLQEEKHKVDAGLKKQAQDKEILDKLRIEKGWSLPPPAIHSVGISVSDINGAWQWRAGSLTWQHAMVSKWTHLPLLGWLVGIRGCRGGNTADKGGHSQC
jgi:hypothetical protein